MPAKRDDFLRAATNKGFIMNKKGDHIFLHFQDSDGKLYPIQTKVSHGSGHRDISDSILAQIKKQLHFNSKEELNEFIRCTLSEEEYRELLREKGHKV